MKDYKVSIILLIIIVAIFIEACGTANSTQSVVVDSRPSMFVKIEDGPYWDVYYHRETKVMYAVSDYSSNSGIFTLLVNSDGTPMVWKGENIYG